MSEAFIDYLEDLARQEDSGALAALRRGLGHKPGTAAGMYPFVVPRLPSELEPWQEDVYYTIAALFAWHPSSAPTGNLGEHLRQLAEAKGGGEAVAHRFVSLLSSHPEDISSHLRQVIGLLRSAEIKVNWRELLRDLRGWGHRNRYVQRKWARGFWGASSQIQSDAPKSTEGE